MQFGIAGEAELEEMLSIASETSMPVGRVFVLTGVITETDLNNLIRCQSLLKENLIDIKQAGDAIQLARQKQLPLDQVLTQSGWSPAQADKSLTTTTPLGELLIAANFISESALNSALARQQKSGLPFGRILVLSGVISENLLSAAVNAQILVRDGKVDREQAVEALKEAGRRQVSVETSLKEKGFYDLPKRTTPRLGELLTFSGIISDTELINALERGLISQLPIGEVLLQGKLITAKTLDAALKVQQMLASSKIGLNQAREILSLVKDGKSFDEAIGTPAVTETPEAKPVPFSLYRFLTSLGRISDNEITQAFDVAKNSTQVLSQVLQIGGVMDEGTLRKAEECRSLVQSRRLSLEHAAVLFDYSQRMAVSIQDALKELQWHHYPDKPSAEARTPITQVSPTQNSPSTQRTSPAQQPSPPAQPLLPVQPSPPTQPSTTAQSARPAQPAPPARPAQPMQTSQPTQPSQPTPPAPPESRVLAAKAPSEEQQLYLGTQKNRALQLTEQGHFADARNLWLEILQHLPETYDTRHCECLEGIAETYTLQQDFDAAQKFYQDAFEFRGKLHGAESLSAAFAIMNLGKIAYFRKNFEDAENYAREYIRLISSNKGPEHPDVACGYQNLATVYHVQSKLKAAEQIYKIAIKICTNALGEAHPTTVRIVRNYASLLQQMSKVREAHALDPLASGTISGNWRALDLAEEERLFE